LLAFVERTEAVVPTVVLVVEMEFVAAVELVELVEIVEIVELVTLVRRERVACVVSIVASVELSIAVRTGVALVARCCTAFGDCTVRRFDGCCAEDCAELCAAQNTGSIKSMAKNIWVLFMA
jgi:uncharacterized membrane protein